MRLKWVLVDNVRQAILIVQLSVLDLRAVRYLCSRNPISFVVDSHFAYRSELGGASDFQIFASRIGADTSELRLPSLDERTLVDCRSFLCSAHRQGRQVPNR